MLMDLESRKYEFIRQLIKVEEPGIMDRLEEILKQETSSGRDSIAQYNKDLDEAIEEIEKGEFFTQEEVYNIVRKW